MTNLTKRQQTVLDTIRTYISSFGYPPTVREIGERIGCRSPNGTICHLKALERKKVIRRDPKAARAIVIVDEVSP